MPANICRRRRLSLDRGESAYQATMILAFLAESVWAARHLFRCRHLTATQTAQGRALMLLIELNADVITAQAAGSNKRRS